ncbi:FAD-dependent oxidoreductase [Reyranella sp. CPCC 100927]|uniref:FAD-dependent oxidoreductase n=1 Tax=Reyranella sp. CPCC 100927 TaxID=2599616 RepID=UPI0011B6985B|nr:FAD-dependent oxidoreductase [Reyranella sp. CPCC 100927]TWS97885.1 FAD-dependent oxidoreductase [Reyranella sp. CPCC 100927]
MHVLIVGAGIAGLGAAWALVRDGHRVTVLEQGAIPNPRGTSVDSHRLIRRAYGAETGYMRMITHAYAAWDRMWADLGVKLRIDTGALSMSALTDDWVATSLQALKADWLPVEELDARQLAERFPLVEPRGIAVAFFSPEGGVLLADRIIAALARWLAEKGAVLRPHAPVASVDADTGTIRLADGETLGADLVLVAAGAWAAALAPALAPKVEPSRQVLAYVDLPDDLARAWATHPSLLCAERATGFYLVPPVVAPDGIQTRLKIGDHLFSRTGDAESDPRIAGIDETRAVFDQARGRLRGLDRYRMAEGKVCFYTVDRRPGRETFQSLPLGKAAWAMSNCSGHGFKFGACLGEAFADMVAGRRSAEAFTQYAAGEASVIPSAARSL